MYDTMSLSVSSLPSWKLAIIEKRRQQHEEERQRQLEEQKRLTEMPAWKREILIRKRQQKNSQVFIANENTRTNANSSSSDGNHTNSLDGSISGCSEPNTSQSSMTVSVSDNSRAHGQECHSPLSLTCNGNVHDSAIICDEVIDDSQADELDNDKCVDHLPHIQHNPWLKSDTAQAHKCKKSQMYCGNLSETESMRTGVNLCNVNETDQNDNYNNEDDVFKDNEVPYGKGFVHKLMQRFKTISTKIQADVTNFRVKRTQSSDILGDSPNRSVCNGTSNLSTVRSYSMENLCCLNGESPSADTSMPMYNSLGRRPKKNRQLYSCEIVEPVRSTGDDEVSCDTSTACEVTTASDVCQNSDDNHLVKGCSGDECEALPITNIVHNTRTKYESIALAQEQKKRPAPKPPVKPILANHLVASYSKARKISSTSQDTDEVKASAHVDNRSRIEILQEEQLAREKLIELEHSTVYSHTSMNTSTERNEDPYSTTDVNESTSCEQDLVYNLSDKASRDTTETKPVSTVSRNAHQPVISKSGFTTNLSSSQVNVSTLQDVDSAVVGNGVKKRKAPPPPTSYAEAHSPVYKAMVDEVYDVTNSITTNTGESETVSDNDAIVDTDVIDTRDVHDECIPSGNIYQLADQTDINEPVHLAYEIPDVVTYEDTQASLENLVDQFDYDIKFDDDMKCSSLLYAKDTIELKKSHDRHVDVTAPVYVDVNGDSSQNSESCDTNGTFQPAPASGDSTDNIPTSKPDMPTSVCLHDEPKQHPDAQLRNGERSEQVRSNASNITSRVQRNELPRPQSDTPRQNHASPFGGVVLRKVNPVTSSGQGSMLIRPASNLVHSNTNREKLNLAGYKDIKTGEFAPAGPRPAHYDDDDDDDDVPVTDIDSYLNGDIPVTNIDDLMTAPGTSPREGTTADVVKRVKFNFIGADVHVGKSLLSKTPGRKLHISFNDAATTTYEYPSEQCLLDELAPEPGDMDYVPPDMPDMEAPSSTLKSTPGVGVAGSLANYQMRYQPTYEFGMDPRDVDPIPQVTRPKEVVIVEAAVVPAGEADTSFFSESATSDMLF